MMKSGFFLGAIALAVMLVVFFVKPNRASSSADDSAENSSSQKPPQEVLPEPLLGETMLVDHARPETPAGMDVRIVSRFLLIANQAHQHLDTSHFSTNADLTGLLLGKEGMSHPQLPAEHPILGKNEHGETSMVDRWQTAYHVHLMERSHLEIVSAGPDKIFGTTDDLCWPPVEPDSNSFSNQ